MNLFAAISPSADDWAAHLDRFDTWQFSIGERVAWEYHGKQRYTGKGTVISRRCWQPGFSSPAEMYVVTNDGDVPFPFVDHANEPAEFAHVTDDTQFEFIYGSLKKA